MFEFMTFRRVVVGCSEQQLTQHSLANFTGSKCIFRKHECLGLPFRTYVHRYILLTIGNVTNRYGNDLSQLLNLLSFVDIHERMT